MKILSAWYDERDGVKMIYAVLGREPGGGSGIDPKHLVVGPKDPRYAELAQHIGGEQT